MATIGNILIGYRKNLIVTTLLKVSYIINPTLTSVLISLAKRTTDLNGFSIITETRGIFTAKADLSVFSIIYQRSLIIFLKSCFPRVIVKSKD